MDLSIQGFDGPTDAFEQGGLTAAIRTQHGQQGSLPDRALKMMNGRVAVISQGDIVKADGGWQRRCLGHSATAQSKRAQITAIGIRESVSRCTTESRSNEKEAKGLCCAG